MRIWSLHPSLLDSKGLVACWRETLLAQKVLQGLTKGYQNHPQLDRFKTHPDPIAAITTYLHGLADEADRRGYRFNRSLIIKAACEDIPKIPVTVGQLDYELNFLRVKVFERDYSWYFQHLQEKPELKTHPLFYSAKGSIEKWEKVKDFPQLDPKIFGKQN